MRDNRDILDKLHWLSNDMEYMEVPGEWLPPVMEAHSIIVRMREQVEKLRVQNIQMQAALGYAICAEDERHIIPSNPFRCGVCDANRGVHARIAQLEAALRDLLRLVEEDPEEDDPSPYLFDQVCDRARAALDYRQRDDRT